VNKEINLMLDRNLIKNSLNLELEFEIPDIDSEENNIFMMIKSKSFNLRFRRSI